MKAVRADVDARQICDSLWADYEVRLRDITAYTLSDLVGWLRGEGVAAAKSSVDRDRRALLARERSLVLAAQKSKQIMELLAAHGDDNVLGGAQQIASQLMFQALSDVPADALTGMEPKAILRLMDTLSKFLRARADADVKGQQAEFYRRKVAELQREFDAKVKQVGKGKKEFTTEDIDQIRQAVFGK